MYAQKHGSLRYVLGSKKQHQLLCEKNQDILIWNELPTNAQILKTRKKKLPKSLNLSNLKIHHHLCHQQIKFYCSTNDELWIRHHIFQTTRYKKNTTRNTYQIKYPKGEKWIASLKTKTFILSSEYRFPIPHQLPAQLLHCVLNKRKCVPSFQRNLVRQTGQHQFKQRAIATVSPTYQSFSTIWISSHLFVRTFTNTSTPIFIEVFNPKTTWSDALTTIKLEDHDNCVLLDTP